MRKYVIEREISSAGKMSGEQLCAAAAKSNRVIADLAPNVQWVESYVADDRLFCVYLASDENVIREHARASGFPASRIVAINRTISPTTANGA
jgi:hypothetical protein